MTEAGNPAGRSTGAAPVAADVQTGKGRQKAAAPRPSTETAARPGAPGMIPSRWRRSSMFERGSMRVLATGGIIGIATALGAILTGQDVAGWIVGLAVGLTSVVLAAILWSSRQL